MTAPQPTRGAAESRGSGSTWTASPKLAFCVKAAVFVIPLIVSWLVIAAFGDRFFRPEGVVGLIIWIVQAIVVGTIVANLVDRMTRRALPLAALLDLSLVFPDQAPSRFGTALRGGTLKKLSKRLEELEQDGLGEDANSAAHAAVELMAVLGAHDPKTRGHTERVRAYADSIAVEMGLDQYARDRLAWSVMLHDIGKLMVPPQILNKTTKLTDLEWNVLKAHPTRGQEIIAPLGEWLGRWDGAAGQHHERWDGTGYPRGLAGEQISLAGKKPMSAQAAREELVRCSGTQFDPDVVRAMLNVSVRRRNAVGPLAWLAEFPRLFDLGAAVASPAAVAAAPAAAVAIGAGDVLAPPPAPETLAFDTPSVVTTVNSTVATSTTSRAVEEPSTAEVPSTSTAEATEATTTTSQAPTSSTSEPLALAAPSTSTTQPSTTTPPTTTAPTTTAPTTTASTTTAPTTSTTQPTTAAPTTAAPTTAAPTTTTPPPTTSTNEAEGPIVENDLYVVEEDFRVRLAVLDNDSRRDAPIDPSTLEIITPPQHARSYDVRFTRVQGWHLRYRS